jgi:hypothetical protein
MVSLAESTAMYFFPVRKPDGALCANDSGAIEDSVERIQISVTKVDLIMLRCV